MDRQGDVCIILLWGLDNVRSAQVSLARMRVGKNIPKLIYILNAITSRTTRYLKDFRASVSQVVGNISVRLFLFICIVFRRIVHLHVGSVFRNFVCPFKFWTNLFPTYYFRNIGFLRKRNSGRFRSMKL